MKTTVLLFAYTVISGALGLIVCGLLAFRARKRRAATIAAVVFFGGPLFGYVYLQIGAHLEERQFIEDIAYVKELCAKQGGDRIHKTATDVDGIFQMKARNPDSELQWRDQYGMVEPWGAAFADRDELSNWIATRGAGYWFIEQQPGYGQSEGPPFRRTVLMPTGAKVRDRHPYGDNLDDPFFEQRKLKVPKLHSRYGYYTEDLSTKEMRRRWIAGGRLKIIDLQSKEVLAERVGFYRAAGPHYKLAWASGYGCFAPDKRELFSFIQLVLRPPRSLPTSEQLQSIKAD